MSGRDPAEVVYLTAIQVLFIHARLLAETGGAPGVRDLGLLESAIARPRATSDGQDLYPDLYAKAAALMVGLVNNHPFVDGNKRVGVTAAALFLVRNGLQLRVGNEVQRQPHDLYHFGNLSLLMHRSPSCTRVYHIVAGFPSKATYCPWHAAITLL